MWLEGVLCQSALQFFRDIAVAHVGQRLVRFPFAGNNKRTGTFFAVMFKEAVNIAWGKPRLGSKLLILFFFRQKILEEGSTACLVKRFFVTGK